jgi:hypothetical protein
MYQKLQKQEKGERKEGDWEKERSRWEVGGTRRSLPTKTKFR